MKKSLVVLMMVALLLASAVPAFAAKGTPPQPPMRNQGGHVYAGWKDYGH